MSASDFWSDQKKASEVSQKAGEIRKEIETWEKLSKDTADLLELSLLEEGGTEQEELFAQFKVCEKIFQDLSGTLDLEDPWK